MMKILNSILSLYFILVTVLSRKPGRDHLLEYQIRSFFRVALLDQCENEEDLAMWLNFILKPFPLVHQARLLYLLYGPLCPDPVGNAGKHWSSIVSGSGSGGGWKGMS